MRLLEVTAFSAAVLVACVGWGRTIERAVQSWRNGTPLPPLSTGVAACLGLTSLLLGAGPIVAADQFHPWMGLLWVLIGLTLAAFQAVRKKQVRGLPEVGLLGVAGMGVLGVQGLFLAARALGNPAVDPCDDYVAYIPLFDRLIETGGLIEPFSQRRVAGLGGAPVLQSLFGAQLGTDALFVADTVFGGLLVGLLLLTLRPNLPRLLLGTVLIASFTLWQSFQTNLSPTYVAAALVAASVLVVADIRRSRSDLIDPRILVLVGVLGAGVLTLRVAFPLAVALLGLALIARARAALGERVRAVGVFGLAFALPVIPWMVALWRSSGTPLYPPISGNLDTSWPFRDPSADLWSKLGDVLARGELRWMIAGLVASAIALVWARRRAAWAEAPLLALPGVAITIALTLTSLSAFRPLDLARYSWPILAGVLVAALALLANEAARPQQAARRTATALIAVVIALALVTPVDRSREELDTTLSSAGNILGGDEGFDEPWPALEDEYRAVQATLPIGVKVATASDYPNLFDHERNDVVNLDMLGSVSPPPGIPLAGSTEEMTKYLRDQGFQFVVVTDPGQSVCLYSEVSTKLGLRSGEMPYVAWAPYWLDWFRWLEARESHAPGLVSRTGTLITLDLRRRQ